MGNDPPPITAETRVSDVIQSHPATLSALIDMGFEPLRSAVARKTVARLFTLRQAADFRGVDLEQLLTTLRRVAGLSETDAAQACVEEEVARLGDDRIPDLVGDVRLLGLVPCPLRSVLTERFDVFARGLTERTGTQVAWWLAGEGAGSRDVGKWLNGIARDWETDRVPEVIMAVGTGLFLNRGCGRPLFNEGVFGPFPTAIANRPDLAPLQDPRGVLGLHFSVVFALSCRPELLPEGVALPSTWADLARPEYGGHVALPALDLPVVPDLLETLHGHLGEELFEGLAANIGAAMHPARSSPRGRAARGPAIVVVPLHFSGIATATGAVEVIPDDGLLALPAYLAVRKDARAETVEVVEYLCSPDFLEPYWAQGSFLPNCADLAGIQLPTEKLICRSWDNVYIDFPEAVTVRLLKMVNMEENENSR